MTQRLAGRRIIITGAGQGIGLAKADRVEIANAMLYLSSAESSYVTGAILAADGGRAFP